MTSALHRGLVRPARRPSGWCAPGPPPAPPSSSSAAWPGPGEDLCYLAGDWRILQRIDGHRWSLDDLVTAWVAAGAMADRPPARVADLGCGIGAVLMLVAWRFPAACGIGLEAQDVSVVMARRSLAWNGIADRCEVRLGDLRDPGALPRGSRFDLVTGTPPYLQTGAATESRRVQWGPCHFEHRGGIEAYCEAAGRLLAPGGRFVACASIAQVDRVANGAATAGLAITSRLDVVPRDGKQPLFSVYAMALAGETAAAPGTDPRAAPPSDLQSDSRTGYPIETLVVRDRSGRRTLAFGKLRAQMGMPP